jgi:hypothetical protein
MPERERVGPFIPAARRTSLRGTTARGHSRFDFTSIGVCGLASMMPVMCPALKPWKMARVLRARDALGGGDDRVEIEISRPAGGVVELEDLHREGRAELDQRLHLADGVQTTAATGPASR